MRSLPSLPIESNSPAQRGLFLVRVGRHSCVAPGSPSRLSVEPILINASGDSRILISPWT